MIWKLFARRHASPKRAISRKTRTWKPTFEILEDRRLLSASWSEFAFNAQHTAESPVASQDLQAIRWQTPVDLNPQYSGNDLLIHYGSPVITASNTVIVPVKTGASDGFEVEALNGGTGSVLWTQTTDYILPPHNWTPSYSPVLTPQNRLYFAGIGGTIFYLDNPDSPGPHTATRLAFYGLFNYNGLPSAYNNSVYIDTPLTADSQGDVFFGFRVTGSNPINLTSGIARIAANGSGTWVSATSAVGDPVNFPSGEVPHNMAPALSNDQSTLYVGVRSVSTSNDGYLLGLNSTTLATKYNSGVLQDPRGTGNAGLLDDSTASPLVGPDGDVYYGVFGNPYNGSRGWMLHFSSNLATKKIPGAFGWDDTASVVPAAMVPSYTGTSSYLIFTKYNNYAGITDGGDGVNKIAVLDPNATEVEPHASSNGLLVMKEILTIAGPTPDPQFINSGFPNAVREWCINSAAFDPSTCSVFANSEDGKLYRWDLDTNTLSQVMTLTPGIGEAYTTTLIGPDGTVYATNNATLFAVDAANHFSISAPAAATAGSAFSITVTAMDENNQTAVGYTGTIHFTTSDMGWGVSLPADYTFTAGDVGAHTFSGGVTLITAGNQSVTATDTTNNSIIGTVGVSVSPAATASFTVAGYPSPVTAGVANNFTVTAKDAFGNITTGYTGTVHFSSSAAKAVLPANYTFTGADAGLHTFSAILRSAGTQSITVTDPANSSITGSQSGIVVNAAAPFKLAIARFPYKPTAGVAGSFRVTAQDMFSNTAPTFADTVHFTSSDPQAVLPADYTFTSSDPGFHDFMATLKTAGSQSITVQDVIHTAIVSATQSNILMQPAAASSLQVSGFPSSVIAGAAHSFTVTAFDPYNNVATGYRGTVMFTSSDNQAMLPTNYSFTSGDAGTHTTFSAILNTGGTQSITATDTVNASLMGTESGIMVVSMQPTASISGPSIGVPGQPLIFNLDASESGSSAGPPYTYTVHWGDGSPDQSFASSNSASAVMASHAFTVAGSFTVSVTATDPQGHRSVPASASPVSITTLAMEADPYYPNQTALYLGGTTGNDNIAITPAVMIVNNSPVYGVKVGMNYVNYGSFFPSRVVVYSQGGTDIIKTAAQTINSTLTYVSVPVMFFAGNGNDILNLSGSGSNANTVSPNNVLVGGGGTDRLIGGRGQDILIGGAGQATLQAGSGGDLLIGGTTAYDNNAAALAAILAEWSRTDIGYTTRMADLTNTTGGMNVINGMYFFLNNGMSGPRTVFGNGLADNLYGGPGLDWYFAGMMDVLVNKTSGEVVTSI